MCREREKERANLKVVHTYIQEMKQSKFPPWYVYVAYYTFSVTVATLRLSFVPWKVMLATRG